MDKMIKTYALELQEKARKILSDRYINDYTRWEWERYLTLASVILNDYCTK